MDFFSLTIAAILTAGAPLVLATLGETLTERAGVINLSLDGTILLSAMTAFAISYTTSWPWLGLICGALVGMAVASILALVGLVLGRSQLAIGFILTLLCRDLAYFLGNPFARQPGPDLPIWNIPIIKDIPYVGQMIGNLSPVVYISIFLVIFCYWLLYKTRSGLNLRAVGEAPRAAFGRGLNVRRIRIIYTLLGGAMVGLAGGAFSLAVKVGWGRPQGCEGAGWICLAIVIFGGWSPLRAAIGAYFFAMLQVLGIHLQDLLPSLPAPLFQAAPFPIMILTLLLVNLGQSDWIQDMMHRYPGLKKMINRWQVNAPAALGQDFQPGKEN